ncbi:hypothetical protein D9M68_700320 [compost metagenome]
MHRVEEVLAEIVQRPGAGQAGAAVQHMHGHRPEQREQRRRQEDQCGRYVPERDHGEDGEGRRGRDGDLWQVLAEEGLQLLDAVHHRQHHAARALVGEPGRPQADDAVVEPAAQRLLHLGRAAVGLHGAPVIEARPQQHHGRRAQRGRQPVLPRRALEDPGQQLPQEYVARNAGRQGQQPQENTARHAGAQALGQPPKP